MILTHQLIASLKNNKSSKLLNQNQNSAILNSSFQTMSLLSKSERECSNVFLNSIKTETNYSMKDKLLMP